MLFKDDPLAFEPGTKVLYSTYGYSLLGCAVEGAAGRPFAEVLREEVFAPAGMTSTQPDDVRALIPHRASGYVRDGSGELLNSALADTSYKVPGGGLCGTAPDVARFGLALLSGRLLDRPTLRQMLTPQKTRDRAGDRLRPRDHGRLPRRPARGLAHRRPGARQHGPLHPARQRASWSPCSRTSRGVGTPLLHLARRIADLVTADRVVR